MNKNHKVLIISRELDGGALYVYTEDAEHFTKVNHKSPENGGRDMSKWVPPSVFDFECKVDEALTEGQWTSIFLDGTDKDINTHDYGRD